MYINIHFYISITLHAMLTCNINHAPRVEWAQFVDCTAVYWKIVKSNFALHIGKYFSIYCAAHTRALEEKMLEKLRINATNLVWPKARAYVQH